MVAMVVVLCSCYRDSLLATYGARVYLFSVLRGRCEEICPDSYLFCTADSSASWLRVACGMVVLPKEPGSHGRYCWTYR